MHDPDARLPGQDLVERGLSDLDAGIDSVESWLVCVGAPRLRRLGVAVPPADRLPPEPEHALYRLLERLDPRGVHGRYNALLRRLVSYERALELRRGRELRRRRSAAAG